MRAIDELANVGPRVPTHEEDSAARGKAGGAEHARTGEGSGATAQTRIREYDGFDRERITYQRLKADLLAHAEGKYVVIVGDEVEGPLETFDDALRAGYRRFGLGPLYVKHVTTVDPLVEIAHEITPCRS